MNNFHIKRFPVAVRRVFGSFFHLPSSIFHLSSAPRALRPSLRVFSSISFPLLLCFFRHPSSVIRHPSLLLCLLLLLTAAPAHADLAEHLGNLHPYISATGLYDSNLYLTQDNTVSDFITTVTPGLKYKIERPAYKFDLGFDLGFNFYASQSELNYVSYNGRLDTFYSFTPRWTFRLLDTITRSRNNLQSYSYASPGGPQTVTGSSSGQGLYIRNIFQPALEYKFGRENLAALMYSNMIYRTEGSTNSGDSTNNSITPSLTYWFNIRNGIALDYTYTNAAFESQPDWVGNNIGGRYLYRFNPRTTAYGDYRYTIRDFEFPGRDYSVHSPSLGLDHAFSPNLNGKAQFGWFWQLVDAGPSFNGPVINLSISHTLSVRTSYNVAFSSGYREQYFTTDNLGFSKYYQLQGGIKHQLRERLSTGLTGSLSRDDYQAPERTDYLYSVTGNVSYQPLKWLTAYLEAGNYGRESDLNGNSYRDNRAWLKLTAEY